MKPISIRLFFVLLFLLSAGRVLAQFNGDGLNSIYFTNPDLTSAAVSEVDPQVSSRWNGCPPQPGMSSSTFSARWTGSVEAAYSEPYTFIAVVGGGVSVVVNGQAVIALWADSSYRSIQGSVSMTKGVKVPLEVDYFTNGANPITDSLQLVWQSPSQGLEIIPRSYLFTGSAINPTPTPQTSEACGASITVDGQLTEWPWAQPEGWAQVHKTVLGNTYSAMASFKTLWDANNLYLGVTVTDSQLTNTGNPTAWKNSTVELYLDTAASSNVTINNNDYEYFFRWNDTSALEYQSRTAGVSLRTATIAGGYLVEASIPWSTLGIGSPSPGTVLGFDLGLDVNHNGGDCRDGQLIWNGGSDDYSNPSGYARLALEPACPTPVATPPAPVGGDPYVSPNPTQGGTVKVVYTMAQAGTAHIKVWNAWGNLVAYLDEAKGAGLQSSSLNVSAFAPGHYFYRVDLDYGSGGHDSFKTQVMAVQK